MKVLITSGGTSEKIDAVRSITNHSTGALGKNIADLLLANGHSVHMLSTSSAIHPSPHPLLTLSLLTNTSELGIQLEKILKEEKIDAVVHAMAVSDYTPTQLVSAQELARFLYKNASWDEQSLEETLISFSKIPQTLNVQKKRSSQDAQLFLTMSQNPKWVRKIKSWSPNTRLVAFKLVVNSSTEETSSIVQNMFKATQADAILQNDLVNIEGDQHLASLFTATGSRLKASTKHEIAALITEFLEEKHD
ncbi:MAG: NAD-dependent epimerase/dehydratase family protein [Streptococcaceae bacterium]|jgi:phosphopantothenate-cysteine ligase|nr:NAD-dependent epimerase/dehydratase family protein [Streptococcaceae bacterium]